MRVEETVVDDLLILTVQEPRISAENGEELKALVRDLVARGQQRIIADITVVGFVDSSGLGALVSCLKVMGKSGEFALCGMSDTVTSLLELTSMDRIFRLFPTREDAQRVLSRAS